MTEITSVANTKIQLIYQAEVNAAMQHNHIPPVREITILVNKAYDAPLDLILENNIGAWSSWKTKINSLLPNIPHVINPIPVSLEWEKLAGLTERLNGQVKLTLQIPEKGEVIFEETWPISLLPYDQWQGVMVLPELLSSFITPNIPAVTQILQQSAIELERTTGSASLDDYQTQDVNRVRHIMSAIFNSIKRQSITYASVPASFELQGQRVRLPDMVIDQHLGNCLDLSLLYASCLEAAGLNPILLITKGHAFAGCWLINETFSDSCGDDPSMITKRTAKGIHEIALVEATSMNAGNEMSFDKSEQQADNHLLNPENFVLWIDIKRSRYGSIRPLPIRVKDDEVWKWKATEILPTGNIHSEILTRIQQDNTPYTTSNSSIHRQKIWERKLLDLSLRNSLLNMRLSAQTLQIIPPPLAELEDMLANGVELILLPKPSDWEGRLRQSGLYEALNASDPMTDLVGKELKNNRIRSYIPDSMFHAAVTSVYRKAKLSMEENGANTLFLAIGVLRWYETPQSQRPRFAPLILTPIEIVRKGGQRGFILRSREEESQMNITLLEMLRQDFNLPISNLLSELPKDESGVDVKKVLNLVRKMVMGQSRWDVEPQILIGHFSFSKFVMWRDIHDHASLLVRNKVVESLISNRITWKEEVQTLTDQSPDKRWRTSELLLPISADSSQVNAIGAAVNGESFVLHGPPGTGKSQTITNIIANVLYRGKRVLFVAEKMAALEVVEKRLESIGLGPYCLELHSNKARKSEVLQQFKNILDTNRPISHPSFQQEASRLEILRTDLNAYAEALHQPGPFGFSLFESINGYYSIDPSCPEISIPEDFLIDALPQKRTNILDKAEELKAAASSLDSLHGHPLSNVKTDEYNKSMHQEAQVLLSKAVEVSKLILNQQEELLKSIGLTGFIPESQETWQLIKNWTALWSNVPDFKNRLWCVEYPFQTWHQMGEFADLGIKQDAVRQNVLKTFTQDILSIDAHLLLKSWNSFSQRWFLPRWLGQRKITKTLRNFARNQENINSTIPEYLSLIISFNELRTALEKEESWITPFLGSVWLKDSYSWQNVKQILDVFKGTHHFATNLLQDPEKLKVWKDAFGALLGEGTATYSLSHRSAWERVSKLFDEFESQILSIDSLFKWKKSRPSTSADWLRNLNGEFTRAQSSLHQLRDWCLYQKKAKTMIEAGLAFAIDSIEQGKIEVEKFPQVINKGIFKLIADHQIESIPALQEFSGDIYNNSIQRFEFLLKQFESLSRQEITATVAERMPNLQIEGVKGSEGTILNRAISNNGRGISIRSLFQQIPNLLSRITPCMLMSPISVAQYLDLGNEPFDLILFDEASQMPTSEAIGALARGKSVIVVGDPKQMPPTSFFASQQFDEDNADKEDLESILDDCLALPMQSRHLLWHYRSKHESLIAFSNTRFYEHKLLTFPSADDIETKVQLVHIDGYYDRSKARNNKAEADAVIDEVLRRLNDPMLKNYSIGIVTFSSAQQILIQDLMDIRLEGKPELDALAYQREEPLFIKNLENVQGDERDVILFSIGYGPDKEGKVYLNFGPINREGGWRRLNVAVSRARYEMKVFSSLRASNIDLSRTTSIGVAGLKAFLEYAEKGKIALSSNTNIYKRDVLEMENEVGNIIRELGYEVHTNVGTSGFKVNLAIINPDKPGTYMLAVLIDGKGFASIPAARDKFVGKIQVLKQLGWRVHRIWSAHWWLHKEKSISSLRTALKVAEGSLNEDITHPIANVMFGDIVNTSDQTLVYKTESIKEFVWKNRLTYQLANVSNVSNNAGYEFYQYNYLQLIVKQLEQIIQEEAPILKELCFQRVIALWGLSKMGARIETQLEMALLRANKKIHKKNGQQILTPLDFDLNEYVSYRVPNASVELTKRGIDYIPVPEIANAMREISEHLFSLPMEELLKETGKTFGFMRMGPTVEYVMQKGLNYGLKNGYLIKNGDRIAAVNTRELNV